MMLGGRRASILERRDEEDKEDYEDGEVDGEGGGDAGGKSKGVSMKMGLLDEGKRRKEVVVEPSAASILDDFNF